VKRGLLPLGCLLFSGCLAALPAGESLPSEQACLLGSGRAIPITIEIAATSAERSRGLMERQTLAPDAGMLFVYTSERQPDQSFWMYKTLIPLDIAYLDEQGVIRAIKQMPPCPPEKASECPTYPAGVPYYQALEMNQGFFEDHNFGVGDRLSRHPSECR
jgi:uncharacterized protein